MKNLVSVPTLVESPFIIVKIGDYTFGQVSKVKSGNSLNVIFPNYMQSLQVTKVNGEVNTYTINMVYPITTGDDPNMLDYVFSTVSESRKLVISYGDWAAPGFIYREEETLITNVKSMVDFASPKISYTLTCISQSLSLGSTNFNFPARVAKPSSIIYELLYNSKYGLTSIFKGMTSKQKVIQNNLIATDDIAVSLEAKPVTNILEYLNYLVGAMNGTADDSTYRLTFVDDNKNTMNGSYFKVTKISKTTTTADLTDSYEIDIGYPTNNFITQFSLNDTEQWTILYNASKKVDQQKYTYRINDDGRLVRDHSSSVTKSKRLLKTTASDESWWKEVTQYPISATLELKGLVRPTILMSYVKLNVLFYGQKHISSGTYIITKEVDTINSSGYKTTLSLLRIKGDS